MSRPAATCRGGHAILTLTVVERPQLKGFTIKGANVISEGTLRGKVELVINRALDPAAVRRHRAASIDSMYQAKGYYLAKITPVVDTTSGDAHVTFNIDEGGISRSPASTSRGTRSSRTSRSSAR